jgi:hypothetical protein
MKEAVREPSGPVEPGKQVTVRATVELAQGEVPVDTWVGWRWKGESEWRKVQDLASSPETAEVTASFPVMAPQATLALEVKVNPDELHPANQTDYRDNAAEVLVEVRQPPPPPAPLELRSAWCTPASSGPGWLSSCGLRPGSPRAREWPRMWSSL